MQSEKPRMTKMIIKRRIGIVKQTLEKKDAFMRLNLQNLAQKEYMDYARNLWVEHLTRARSQDLSPLNQPDCQLAQIVRSIEATKNLMYSSTIPGMKFTF